MPYELRPEAKLKRPARYNETDDLGPNDSPEPKSGNRDSIIDSDGLSPLDTLIANPSTPESSSFTTDAPHLRQNLLPESDVSAVPRCTIPSTSGSPKLLTSRKMTNVKYVKKHGREDTSPGNRRVERSNTTSHRATIPQEDELFSTLAAPRPSAFPSLTDNIPPLPSATVEFTKHGLRDLIEALDDEDDERVRKIKRRFAVEYEAGTSFWYDDLKTRWPSATEQPIVTFENLWPSIRQTIIEQIQDDFTPGTYFSSFYPVCRILGITKEELDKIMTENARVWDNDDIPEYFKEYRKRYPKAIIDPDEPPPPCIVAAIVFLKQNSLPGSLLGEWQALPAVEGSANSHTGYIAKSIKPVVPDRIRHESRREHPHTISIDEALELAWRAEKRARKEAMRAGRKQQDANKLTQLECRACGEKGHTFQGLNKDGVHKCPQRRQEAMQHRTEIETLRAQASTELEAMAKRDRALETAPPHSTLSMTGPIDATPFLEAWKANRANGQSSPATQMSIHHGSDRPINPPNPLSRPHITPLNATIPRWPDTTYPTQQQAVNSQQSAISHVPKKRGPYKKKEKKAGHASSTPPNRVVGRDGMVFLSSSRQAHDETAFQKWGEGVDATTVEMGVVTPPPLQKKQQGLSSTPISTHRAGETFVAERHVAAVLPPYPCQASPTQKPGHVPLLEKTGAVTEQRKVGGEEEETPMMDVAP